MSAAIDSAAARGGAGLGAAHRAPGPVAGLLWLIRRELIRFGRQPSRIIAAIGTPALIWLVLGSGFAGSFSHPSDGVAQGANYAAFLVPGMATMIVLFSSIFAAISLIEDRHEGFLQSVLISPAPLWSTLVSKVGACTIFATAQAIVVLIGGLLTGLHITPIGFVLALAALVMISMGISGVGLAAAWYVNSTQGFHGVMNLVLMPMWLLSGSVFPVTTSASWMSWIMRINPLTWPTEALREAITGGGLAVWPWAGAGVFAVVGLALPWVAMRRSSAV